LAKRRRDRRTAWASALGAALGVHGLVLWAALSLGPSALAPPEHAEPVQPFFIELQPPPPLPPAASAAAGSSASAVQDAAPGEAGQPAPVAHGEASSGPPGPAPFGPRGAGGQGAQPQAALKFDCADAPRRGRDPCLFRNAPRDKLPEDVIRQASIDADKAAYYDRVLDARERMRNDFSYGNTAMFTCKITFGGGKPAQGAKIPHSLKLGSLPCFIVPPHGSLTPDVFVQPIPPKNPDRGLP
jgi:hypothetical protein